MLCGLFTLTLYVGVKIRVYCPVGKSDQGKLALDIAVKALEIFTK